MRKSKYISPAIVRSVAIETDTEILAGSVVDKLNEGGVDTTPQAVESTNFDNGESFNHVWE